MIVRSSNQAVVKCGGLNRAAVIEGTQVVNAFQVDHSQLPQFTVGGFGETIELACLLIRRGSLVSFLEGQRIML